LEYKNKASDGKFVLFLYRYILGREPDPAGFASWLQSLAAGQSRSSVVDRFLDSSEFNAVLTNELYVSQLYWKILGRAPDAPGLEAWVQLLRAGTPRSSIRKAFFDSQEFGLRAIDPLNWTMVEGILGWRFRG
jgi:hypothetical protein